MSLLGNLLTAYRFYWASFCTFLYFLFALALPSPFTLAPLPIGHRLISFTFADHAPAITHLETIQ